MKTKNIDVHGVYSLFNTGGIEVHIEEGYDPFILWRFSIIDTEPQKWHKAKINDTAAGRAYFRANGKRIYLDQVMHV
jgi:hypothetical protein